MLRTVAALVILLIIPAPHAAQVAVSREAGVTGMVLAPDGSPVTQGAVALMTSATNSITAAIDRTGHFRIVPDSPGWQRLFISVPGLAPYRLHITVPSSRIMALPDITLAEATYFRARFVTSEGEPLAASGLRRQSIDSDGATIPDPLGHVREQIDGDGMLTLGPLFPGKMLLALDRPSLAQTRLRDIDVTGDKPVIDGGVITIARGATLHVEILDGDGRLVPRHDVWIEDAVRPSPLSFPMLRTDERGHVAFDRLGPGRFRVWTRTAERCGNQELTLSRVVSTSGSGDVRARVVIGGRATLRITSPLGPVPGRNVHLSPDSPPEPPWQARYLNGAGQGWRLAMPPRSASSCAASTESDGRFTMAPFPPGPAQLRVVMFNSSYIVRANVPEAGREMVIALPDGLLPVRVINQTTRHPVGGAHVKWVGGGATVEAIANPNGDALLESVGAVGGTLTISERGFQTLEGGFEETPGTMQEVALTPVPSDRLAMSVVDNDGEAVAGAVVGLRARDRRDADEFVVADAKGIATFTDVPPGDLQFVIHANGFASANLRIAEENRIEVVVTLTRQK